MKKAKLIALLVLVIVFGIFAGCSNNSESNNDANSDAESKSADADGTLELRLGHIFPVDSVKDRAANMFAERIEEETNGKIKITVYPASQLGGDEVMAKDISRGTLDMSFINQGSLAGLDP
ncbi:MAG: TRAP transporter substrate-binding protein DctP, partial [Bacilli bacterium]|nr:TRAP transporter substrate-binding protein DctP [Bacilli bacterium]